MSGATRLGLLTLVLLFGVLGTLCGVAPLGSAVIGSGALAVHGNHQTVQHREGGIVADLAVHEGSLVQQGELLIRLDGTQALASFRVHQSQLLADEALIARDLAELADASELVFPADLTSGDEVAAIVMNREQIVFHNHRDLLRRQLDVIEQRIQQVRYQESGTKVQVESANRQLQLAEDQLKSITTLQQQGLESRNRWLEFSRSVEAIRGQTGQLAADVARFGAQAMELKAEELRIRESVQADATRELREAQLRINDVLPRLMADRDLLNRLEIRAPIAGDVVNLAVFTKGGVIEPGHPIMDIVPSNRTIVAEVEIRPEDIEYLHIGQLAQVIATGFNPRETAPIPGQIQVISADRVTDSKTGQGFFRVEISLIPDEQNRALLRRLTPGMPVQVVIPVASRTALDYLVGPLRSSFRSALREP
jgi:HlyD family type I secretion membrane fusion protein